MVSEKQLEESQTYQNLKKAFIDEAALAFRYLYYATIAEFEGLDKHSTLFKEIGEGGNCNAHGCFDFLKLVGDPDSGIAVRGTFSSLESLIQTETRQSNQIYAKMAKIAREEGFLDIASWFDTLEKLKRSHVRKLRKLAHDEELHS